jgi:NAD+ kinase
VKLGVVPKFNSPEALEIAASILEYAESLGVEAFIDWRVKDAVTWKKRFTIAKDRVDVIVVVGGDGTVLGTLQLLGESAIPLITVRYGKRGFLCDVPPFEYKAMIDRLVEGRYKVREYMRLKAVVNGRPIPYALNEYAIVTNGDARSKVGRIDVMKNGEEVFNIVGDGVIVASPVGSTAYSLAAGGPVVDPLMEAIIVTPLAPATLCSRPVVLPPSSTVEIAVRSDSPSLELMADGQYRHPLKPGDKVRIERSPKSARFLRFFEGDFYVKLFSRCM